MSKSSRHAATARLLKSAALFAALGDGTRLEIVARLADGSQQSITQLTEDAGVTRQAITKHLKVLENAGLISRGQDAQRRPRKIEPAALEAANQWLERYREIWEANYARLDVLLETLKQDAKKTTAKKRKK